jgi:hypothetical protein
MYPLLGKCRRQLLRFPQFPLPILAVRRRRKTMAAETLVSGAGQLQAARQNAGG